MIIGLTGKSASGKGEVANYLKTRGFSYCSLSDELRKEADKRGLEPSRENLIPLGNDLRKEFGADILAKKVIEKIKKGNEANVVIDSIRNPSELKEIKKLPNSKIIAIDAPIEIRFKRAMKRGRTENAKTLEEFRVMEEKEESKEKKSQQLNTCFEMADIAVVNDSSLEELHKKIDNIFKNV